MNRGRSPIRPFALEAHFSRWRACIRHHLTASDSETVSLSELLATADAKDTGRWEHLQLGYTDPRGADWLRETISESYGTAGPGSVLCFAGAQEGIHATMHALLGADDHAIVVTPNYQTAETIPLGLCAVTGVGLDPARNWTLDIEAVEAAMQPNTRLVSINFPNNPTGKILERDRFDALVTRCRQRGIWLFSDEVYRLIERDPAKRLPPAVDAYERGISLGAVSKSYGLPGLRIGWIACHNPDVLRAIERARSYLSVCNSPVSELLARIALRSGDWLLARNRGIALDNLALLEGFLADHADLFDWHAPDGGVVGYPRYHGPDGVETFCRRLVEENGVMLLPASVYRSEIAATPDQHFRIGFGRKDFAAGLRALEEALPHPSLRRASAGTGRGRA